jgi:hypothetical protein
VLNRWVFLISAYAVTCVAQNSTFEGLPAFALSNGTLSVQVLREGSALVSIKLVDDDSKLNPLWNPIRSDRLSGRSPNFVRGEGQFVCVDGFGAPSHDEASAGLPMHGEAHVATFELVEHDERGITLSANLPLVHEKFTRTFHTLPGENVVYIDSTLESELAFDRPLSWAEHATIGSPFLESGATVVDVSGSRSRTRPYDAVSMGPMTRRIASAQNFTWPMAPGLDGHRVDLRETPANAHYMDHATTLLDPDRKLEWVTAINRRRHLVLGYIFRRADYPWLQYWGNYPPNGEFARGLEFATQPFDVPRRDAIESGSLFNTPTYRWLPAMSKVETHFLVFYAPVPDGFDRVDDVRIEAGQILVEDRTDHKQITLKAALASELKSDRSADHASLWVHTRDR